MMLVTRKFGVRPSGDAEWKRRCKSYGLDPDGVFEARIPETNQARIILRSTLNNEFYWNGFAICFSIAKDQVKEKTLKEFL